MAKRTHVIEAKIASKGAQKTQKDLKKTTDSIKNLAKGAKNAGLVIGATAGVIAGAFLKITKSGADFTDQLAKTSVRLGTTVRDLNTLGFAAEQAGADIFAVRTGFRRLSQAQFDAAQGLLAQKDAFTILGVEVQKVDGSLRDTIDVFKDVATAVANMEDRTLAAALAQKILGRSGDLLLPLLLQGGEGIEKFGRILELLNADVDNLSAALGEEMVDSMNFVNRAVKGLSVSFLNVFGRTIIDVSKLMALLIARMGKFVEANSEAFLIIGKSAVIIAGLGLALVALTTNMILVAAAATFLLTPLGGVVALSAALAPAFIIAAVAMLRFRDVLVSVGLNVAKLALALSGLVKIMKVLPGALNKALSEDDLVKFGLEIADLAKGFAAAARGAENFTDVFLDEIIALAGDLEELNELIAELPRNMGNAAGAVEGLLAKFLAARDGTGELVEEITELQAVLNKMTETAVSIQPVIFDFDAFEGLSDPVRQLGEELLRLNPGRLEDIAAIVENISDTVAILALEMLALPSSAAVAADAVIGSFFAIGNAIGASIEDALARGVITFKSFADAILAEARRLVAQLVAIFAVKGLFALASSIINPLGAVSTAFNAAGLFNLPGGGFAAAHGGIVTGGSRFQDSVPILAQAGERIIPAENSLDSFLGDGGGVNPTQVNFNNSVLLGSEAEFNEFSRRIAQSQNFLENGLFE